MKIIIILLLICWVPYIVASEGDRDDRYRECLSFCVVRKCEIDRPASRQAGQMVYLYSDVYLPTDEQDAEWLPGVFERLLVWSCDDNCRYECSQKNTALRLANGERVVQYHGKWPFLRLLGMQELFSSLFSVLNALPHLAFLSALLSQKQPRLASPYRWHWASFAVVGLCAWFWSAVFHARDTLFTERMDYFGAFLLIVWGLWVAIVRTLEIRAPSIQFAVLALILLGYGYHVYYLTYVHFDYGYNMLVNVLSAITGSLFWLVWIYRHRQRKYANILLFAILGVYPMSLLELLDFSPFLSLIDAHAIWHASTIPFCFILYAGIQADLEYIDEKSL